MTGECKKKKMLLFIIEYINHQTLKFFLISCG